jgi:ABC-type glycerol-3-phosphate transport system substrate-binding protein
VADYPPLLLAPFRSGSALYGLPDEVYFPVLHYNPVAFDTAGLSYPTSAWTFDDLLHAATQLTRGTGPTKQYSFAVLGDVAGDQTADVLFFLDRLGAPLTRAVATRSSRTSATPLW